MQEWQIIIDGEIVDISRAKFDASVKLKARSIVQAEGRICSVEVALFGTPVLWRAAFEPGRPLVWALAAR